MAVMPSNEEPFGGPGMLPNWSVGSKNGVGTSVTAGSKVWFTLAKGIVTEVFYPTVDVANTRDLQFLVTGPDFFDEESVDTDHELACVDPDALAFRLTNTAKNGRYRITKSIVTDPERNSLVVRVSFEALAGEVEDYRLYLLLAPHLKNMGYGNSARVVDHPGGPYITAWREDVACALASTVPFLKTSVGYSGSSDGWTDIAGDRSMDWSFDNAGKGNLAATAELDLAASREFTICLSFGPSVTDAVMEARATLARGYERIEREYVEGWKGYLSGLDDLSAETGDGGRLYRTSAMVLKAHADKTHGGVIASLSIPWGEVKGDRDAGGYHLVWPRDLANAAMAFLAMGETECPMNILEFLARTQRVDGSWPQNMWLDGRPYWTGVQLDEVAFPVILAWRLRGMGLVKDDYYYMVKRAAEYLVRHGPVTEQERWEELRGFSPATLAAEITALVCAARWAAEEGEERESRYLFEIADYWNARVEEWTFSECDCLGLPEPGHFMRIVTEPVEALEPGTEVCHAEVFIKNLPPGSPHHQGEIVDAGFLELVRYGVRPPDDPFVVRSLNTVDRMLRIDMPYGPLFYRYNNDGYGEKEDGSPFDGSGVGRPWPLLAAERGVYEVMAGRSGGEYIRAVEGAANEGGMLPEQVWDGPELPERRLRRGRGTGSATPLVWAHAEYVRLLRTRADGRCRDLVDEVAERYSGGGNRRDMAAWKINKPIRWTRADAALRVVSRRPGAVVWTRDGWDTRGEVQLADSGLGIWYADFPPGSIEKGGRFTFTFRYGPDDWEGLDYDIDVI